MDLFIVFLFIGLFILLFIIPTPSVVETKFSGKREKTWCPPHTWTYGSDGFLYCNSCGQKPGYEPRE